MRAIFSLALIGAIAYAAQREEDEEEYDEDIEDDGIDADVLNFLEYDYKGIGVSQRQDQHAGECFSDYLARCNRSYDDAGEFKKREKLWKKSVKKIEEMNAAGSATTFGTNNCDSELTFDEKQARTGADEDINDEDQWTSLTNRCVDDDTIVCDSHTPIDWVADGKVHAIKDQGWCGSCWAFAAALALESKVAIESDSAVVRLSEQQGVDCTTDTSANQDLFGKTYGSWGCDGGWMEQYWDFAREQGAMTDAEYPYTGSDDACKHDNDKVVVNAGSMISLDGDVQSLKDQLADGPFTIAVQAGDYCWDYYQGGILTYRDECGDYWLDHAVTVVGIGMETVTFETKTPNTYKSKCKVKPFGKCKKGWKKRNKGGMRYCCKKKLIEEGEVISETVDQEYWLVQNSWGPDWGANGFVKLGVEGGYGVSGMNTYAEAINVSV